MYSKMRLHKIIAGEQNTYYDRDKYNCTFPKMIQAWRNVWYTRTNSTTDPEFPFGFVQVSSRLLTHLISSCIFVSAIYC
jgi:sialate O-acetylesterase